MATGTVIIFVEMLKYCIRTAPEEMVPFQFSSGTFHGKISFVPKKIEFF